MTLLRVYVKMDSSNKIAIPRGIRKTLDIKPGEKLELTIAGMNKVKKLLVTKSRPFYPIASRAATKNCSHESAEYSETRNNKFRKRYFLTTGKPR